MRVQQGFSLVELMVTLAIIVILITVAVPSFNSSLLRADASSLADSLISSLNYAKSEAVSRNERIYLCARNANGSGCLNNSADWDGGWLIRVFDGDEILRDVRIGNANAEVSLENANADSSDNRLVYKPSGEVLLIDGVVTITPNGLIFTAQIAGCDAPQLDIRRAINIALSGLATVGRVACQ
ncbi:MAG: GspH/FimT family pseudopilin [Oceanospirillaceae bacterium]